MRNPIVSTEKRSASEALGQLLAVDHDKITNLLEQELRDFNKKIIVLDDDPTGVQTVHGISVYTDWSVESIEKGFLESNSMFFILTNSRGFIPSETEAAHQKIAENIAAVSAKLNKEFIVISRGDSTLRGHYPLETKTLQENLELKSTIKFDGEMLLPFFKEGGRLTLDNIHYLQHEDELIPAGETEFAKDRAFGYASSHLGEWVEEKSNGEFKADSLIYITLESIRALEIDKITSQFLSAEQFNKIIVNAVDYIDVKIVTIALIKAMKQGKNYMFRSAAALTKVIGGVSDKALLTREELIKGNSPFGGLIIIGSHVSKTTEQLEELKKCDLINFIELDVHLVIQPRQFKLEVDRVIRQCEEFLRLGHTVTVYTRRDRFDLGGNKREEELQLSVKISDAVTRIVQRLNVRPRYIVAKGGITSSDIGTKGLKVQRATVAGQIKPGIPVWITGEESKFPGIAYIIFPGNVGTKTTLKETVQLLDRE